MEETGHQVGKWGEGQGGRRCRRRERRAPGWLDAADPAGRAQGARCGGERGWEPACTSQTARYKGEPARTSASAGLPATTRPQPGCGARTVTAAGHGVHAKANTTDTHKAPSSCRLQLQRHGHRQHAAFFQDTTNSL